MCADNKDSNDKKIPYPLFLSELFMNSATPAVATSPRTLLDFGNDTSYWKTSYQNKTKKKKKQNKPHTKDTVDPPYRPQQSIIHLFPAFRKENNQQSIQFMFLNLFP